MASTAHLGESPISTDALDGAVEEYPRDRRYVMIALILGAITVVEVMTYLTPSAFGGEGSFTFVIAILAMMCVKFFMVAWFFMHLKFDNRLLSWVIWIAIGSAGAVYVAILCTFRVFWPDAAV
jgi:cytochrome c oxidase subunit 4